MVDIQNCDVIFDNKEVEREYIRWRDQFGPDDPYESQETVGLHDILRAHFLIVDYFYSKGSGLGGVGPKDPDMLHSAIYRQFVSFGGKDKWENAFERAATLMYGIVSDHPFHDANKRTGLLAILLFFQKMNRTPTVGQKALEDFAVDVADHKLDKYRRYKDLKKKVNDAEVLFIADYLKRNSRNLDKRYYAVTYRELVGILKNFGYELSNPKGNHIDVIRKESRRKLFGFGRSEQVDVKVAQIGFPGWKSVVGKGAIATIRRETGLTPENGFDSETFYRGADPIQWLIAEYSKPLERLAYR